MPRYDILFLDADNTLFDFDRSEHEALTEVFHSRGYAFTEAQERLYNSINKPLWDAFDRGEITREFLSAERYRRFQLEVDGVVRHDPVKMNEDYQLGLSVRPYLLEGAEEVVRGLAGKYRLYVVTNGLVVAQRRVTNGPLSSCFDGVFVSAAMGSQKPHADYYDKVFAALGLSDADKPRILLIGDNPISDILGGQNYGLDTCWLRLKPDAVLPEGVCPTYTIGDIRELPALLVDAAGKSC